MPCGVCYHTQCFRVGPPFTTRRLRNAGLSFPPVGHWPHFICEACTVRAVLQRELIQPRDRRLMALERMRIIDLAHHWSLRTHISYQQRLLHLQRFTSLHGIPGLKVSHITHPPHGWDILLMWAQEDHSLRHTSTSGPPRFGTVRQLRSAMAYFFALDAALGQHQPAILDRHNRLLFTDSRKTDTVSNTLFASGLAARLGTATTPAVALLFRHVAHLNADLERRYLMATDPDQRILIARGAMANLLLWLGWLRSSELLQLRWADITLITPEDSVQYDLPPHCGALLLRLQPETKSSRHRTADVIIAYTTAAGLSPGMWCLRAAASLSIPVADFSRTYAPIFQHADGSAWTSFYFRSSFLYPSLLLQRSQGDPFLRAFDDSPGNSIPKKYWSLHCYRRGARTHVSRSHPTQRRKATPAQVYEHGRWRRRASGEPIDIRYREWTIHDRVLLTLYSM